MKAPKRHGSDLRKLIEFAKGLGFTCETTGSTQLSFRRPHTRSVWASMTPSCWHARKNTRHDLIRAVREAEKQAESQPPKE